MIDSYDDFARKYDHCYLLVRLRQTQNKPWGEDEIVYLSIVDAQTTKKYKLHLNLATNLGEDTRRVILPYENVMIIPKFPSGGYFNYDNNCHFVSRTPYRQWKRAVNSKTINTFSLTEVILKKYMRLISETGVEIEGKLKRKPFLSRTLYRVANFSIPYVSSMYWKTFPTYKQAFIDLDTKKTSGSVALSENFAIGYSCIHNKISMYSYINPIADIDNENIYSICVTEPLYFQEIQDFFSRKGINVYLTTK